MALLANTCHNLGLATEAAQPARQTASADGRWAGSEGTIVGSKCGNNVDVEASALVLISLLHESDKYSNAAPREYDICCVPIAADSVTRRQPY